MRRSIILLAVASALCAAAPAQAGLLSGVLPGLVSSADTPDVCETSLSQPFARWGDSNYYVLVPGGSFEPGTPAWKLGAGARIVLGNEPFYVHSKSDRYSLDVPAGVTVTTPPMCFQLGDWHARLFATGGGTIKVKVVVKSLLGVLSILDGGTIQGSSTWQPSPRSSCC